MSQATLFILTALFILSLGNCQLESDCQKPKNGKPFGNISELLSYIRCIKESTSEPMYGKRSIPEQSGLFYKLHPAAIQTMQPNPEYVRKIVYEILRAERDFQA